MRRYRVVFTEDARRDYKREVARWRQSHSKNTYLLEDEIAAARKLLSAVPRFGEASADPRLPGVRRVVLQKSEFLLHYLVLDEERRVDMLRLWYAPRGARPKLRLVRSKSAPRRRRR